MGGTRRVLIVEDDERIIRFMKRGLEAEGYLVDVASNGEAGINLAKTGSYHVILLDVYLPGINGLEVCRKLRQHSMNTPIVMMTAQDVPQVEQEAIQAGVNGYLPKPFSFEVLLSKIGSFDFCSQSS